MVVFGEVVTVVVGKVDTTVTTFGRFAPMAVFGEVVTIVVG